jgi:prepilin-type N-terminal cleavage/methylation domain-containing protein
MRLQRLPARHGFTLVELLVAVAIISLLLTVAILNLQSAHRNANEVAVMREVQTVYQAQTQYYSQFGEYAATLAHLGPPATGPEGPESAKLIPASLSSGERNGYIFTMARTPTGFRVNANPKVPGKDGRRTFYIDEDGMLRQNWGSAPATADSPEVGK